MNNIIREDMTTVTMNISPDQARLYLRNNVTKNRPLNHKYVNQLAEAMTRGAFILTPQGIAFDKNDNLIDGQHRLNAIIKSGCTIPMRVTFGCDVNAFEALDIGHKRTVSDLANINNLEPCMKNNIIIGAIDFLVKRRGGSFYNSLTPAEKLEIIDMNKNITRVYYECCVSKKMRPMKNCMHAALLESVIVTKNVDALFAFRRVYELADVNCGDKYSPGTVVAFKNRYLLSMAKKESIKSDVLFNLVQNCFYNFSTGTERKISKNTQEDKYIVNFQDFITGKYDKYFEHLEITDEGVQAR